MTNKKTKDYVFNINWEDKNKNVHKVGFLADINNEYYCLMVDEEHSQSACKNGFVGLPGFDKGKIYKSKELFDFFQRRILDKTSNKPCEELAQTGGISMTDSFSVNEVPKKLQRKNAELILRMYEIQSRRNKKIIEKVITQ